ncbi:hypothetical protein A3E15_03605 [Candidatus Woesebacteria bacterium RIFCSPHIGHO2_12_FULL_42_9]|uniref:Regulatory protein RecX n=1 Tax=Candidatus Woesebacteria bacterium RIFCSPHIGHO2_12_FULL_42_9 TaxID=1802511 RepID=A0A1F8AWU6_9BACT|nr:MAG: hypothetical protein A3E15_03605 [Candidatus Woesebacteria bacterium RIFCSPHIGHO2_12_FULL_42_9]
MPKISAISPQKNGKRVNIYLDGKFGFGIDLENYVTLGLKVENELTDEKVKEILKKAEFQKTLEKILKFATLRPRSEREIRGWLKRKKIHESLHKDLFDRLNHLDLVDDRKFTEWWVGQRLEFSPRAKRIIDYELRAKGIKKEVIDEVLSEVKVDEEGVAKTLLEKKSYRWKKIPKLERKKKMTEFLARKGFSWEIIVRAIDHFKD